MWPFTIAREPSASDIIATPLGGTLNPAWRMTEPDRFQLRGQLLDTVMSVAEPLLETVTLAFSAKITIWSALTGMWPKDTKPEGACSFATGSSTWAFLLDAEAGPASATPA